VEFASENKPAGGHTKLSGPKAAKTKGARAICQETAQTTAKSMIIVPSSKSVQNNSTKPGRRQVTLYKDVRGRTRRRAGAPASMARRAGAGKEKAGESPASMVPSTVRHSGISSFKAPFETRVTWGATSHLRTNPIISQSGVRVHARCKRHNISPHANSFMVFLESSIAEQSARK
jgi:hypothetical protein